MTTYKRWIGRQDECEELIAATPVRLLAATLDLPPVSPDLGDLVPPMWHWLYFLRGAPQSQLGEDGHPRRGYFYPDVTLRRRMFGGSQTTIHRLLRVGEKAVQRREIVDIKDTEGSSGPLVIVKVNHEVEGTEGLAVSETQLILYTDSRPKDPDLRSGDAPDAPWYRDVPINSPLLFRFSAVTYNSHRIHYDRPYATDVEGYPDLVVHGPLIALLLCEVARGNGMPVRRFEFRGLSPAYVGDTIHLRGTPSGDGADLAAYRRGIKVMEAYAS